MSYLVHVPEARGRVIPEIDSMSEDFPALCEPSTAMMGMSRSRWALGEKRNEVSTTVDRVCCEPHPVARRRLIASSMRRF
jgi:hypothetical protein